MRVALITAVLAAATLSFAASPVFATQITPPAPATSSHSEPTFDLGVDITQAGGSSASVKAFVAHLAANTQASVKGGCQTVAKYPAGYQQETRQFCALLSN